MKTLLEKAYWLFDKLQFTYQPVGLTFTEEKPADALYFKKAGSGCIATLIFSASKGKTIAIDRESTGYPCSAFYLGFKDWIFNGIEYFLSNSPVPIGRDCERFVENPRLAKAYVESFVPGTMLDKTYVFKPVVSFTENEEPEIVIFFANADQLSALVFLIQYSHPLDFDRSKTGFASACAAMTTIPLQYARKGEDKAFWGLHDVSIRPHIPAEVMTMAMPFSMFKEICTIAPESFLGTEKWKKVLERINPQIKV